MDYQQQKINAELANLKIQETGMLWRFAWISLVGGWLLGGAVSVWVSKIPGSEDYEGLFVLILFPAGVIIFILFLIQIRRVKKNNMEKLAAANSRLHQIYFDCNQELFPEDLKFDGIFPTTSVSKNCLSFNIGSEKITWGIIPVKLGKELRLDYSLVSSSKKLDGVDWIAISEERESKNLFNFESVEFTKRFKIEGSNAVDIYKILNPKIIDNFVQKRPHFLTPKTIELNQGTAKIEGSLLYFKGSWTADPLDFSKIHWTRRKMVSDILSKVEADFSRFLEIQNLLEPLELYEGS